MVSSAEYLTLAELESKLDEDELAAVRRTEEAFAQQLSDARIAHEGAE